MRIRCFLRKCLLYVYSSKNISTQKPFYAERVLLFFNSFSVDIER